MQTYSDKASKYDTSYIYLCRACIPVVAAIGSVVIEKKTPTRNEFIGLFVIVSGVVIAVYEGSDSKASIMGIALCILGKGYGV